jgi:SAM-dependent methyltransferase
LERHRLQYLTLTRVLETLPAVRLRVLHFAPEPFLSDALIERVGRYETADLYRGGVTHIVDIRALPFEDGSYDLVFASHVLEHVREDRKAIEEVRRILTPEGVAVLPVPIVGSFTVEYPGPNPNESGHVRAPGLDYFERYREVFSRVELLDSTDFPDRYQLFTWEDRTGWPTAECPLRLPMKGERHVDFVPLCYA